MTKLEKKEGNIEQCPNCKTKIYCRLKPAVGEYPAKLQWQNESGAAHYSFNFATKETTCGTTATKNIEIDSNNVGLDKAQLDQIQQETEKILKYQLARISFIEQGLKKRGIPFTGAFVGMLYNQQMESLR